MPKNNPKGYDKPSKKVTNSKPPRYGPRRPKNTNGAS